MCDEECSQVVGMEVQVPWEKEVTGSLAYLQGASLRAEEKEEKPRGKGRRDGTPVAGAVRAASASAVIVIPGVWLVHLPTQSMRAGAWRGTWAHQLMSNLRQWLSSLRGECECARGYKREACIDVHQVTAAYRCIAEEQSCCFFLNGHAACCRPFVLFGHARQLEAIPSQLEPLFRTRNQDEETKTVLERA